MNEDDFNLSEMYGQQPPQRPQPQQQPIEMPWSYQDNLQLQQNMQGLASVDSEVAKGEITAEEGQIYKQQIGQRLAPLQAKQKQFQAQQQAQQQTQLMHQMALQESIQQQHAQAQAQAFPQTVASFTDPLTGRTAHFFQGKRGDWKPIDHGDFAEKEVELSGAESRDFQGANAALPAGGTDPPEIDKPLYEEDIPALREEQRQREEEARANRASGPSEIDRWRSLPENPTDAQVKRWAAGQTNSPLSLEDYAQAMRDDQGGQGSGQKPVTLSQHELGVLRQRAEQTIPRLQMPPGGISTPQQARAFQAQQLQRAKAVDQLTNHLSQTHLQTKQREADMGRRVEEHKRQEAARMERDEAKKTRQADEAKQEKERRAAFRHHYSAAGKEKEGDKLKFATHESRVEEAKKRLAAEDDFIKPKEPEADKAKVEEQAKKFGELMDKVAGGSGQPAPAAVPPEVGRSDSSIGADEVKRMTGVSQKHADSKSWFQRNVSERGTFSAAHNILYKAHSAGRGLTVAERAWHEHLMQQARKAGHVPQDVFDQLKPGKTE